MIINMDNSELVFKFLTAGLICNQHNQLESKYIAISQNVQRRCI